MPAPKIILASSSPQRRQLLHVAGYDFEVAPPDEAAECGVCSTGGPAALVAEAALRKLANVVARLALETRFGGCFVIGCDTVAECHGQILGKPRDRQHARAMLVQLRGSVHRVYSGLAVCGPLGPEPPPSAVQMAVSELEMEALADEQLDAYLDSGQWRGKAGAFGLQDQVDWIHRRNGSESNVIGLPLELLKDMLDEAGYSP